MAFAGSVGSAAEAETRAETDEDGVSPSAFDGDGDSVDDLIVDDVDDLDDVARAWPSTMDPDGSDPSGPASGVGREDHGEGEAKAGDDDDDDEKDNDDDDDDDDDDEKDDDSWRSDRSDDGACRSTDRRGRRGGDCRFECNICLDPVSPEPVVTRCGHLFCWPCLYRWLEPGITPDEAAEVFCRGGAAGGSEASWQRRHQHHRIDVSRRVCPVCKAECTVPTVVPVYVRTEDSPPALAGRRRRDGVGRRAARRRTKGDADGKGESDTGAGSEVGGSRREEHDNLAGGSTAMPRAEASVSEAADVDSRGDDEVLDGSSSSNVDPTVAASFPSGLRRRYPLRMRRDPPPGNDSTSAASETGHGLTPSAAMTTTPAAPSSRSPAAYPGAVPSRPPPPRVARSAAEGAAGSVGGGGDTGTMGSVAWGGGGFPPGRGGPRPASLSNGMALAFHRGLFQSLLGVEQRTAEFAVVGVGGGGGGGGGGGVPPIHRRPPEPGDGIGNGGGDNVASREMPARGADNGDAARFSVEGSTGGDAAPIIDGAADATTEFLSRLLLMLGSFVILCLLLF